MLLRNRSDLEGADQVGDLLGHGVSGVGREEREHVAPLPAQELH